MAQLTVPDSWGSSLRESNDCHEPGGQPTGGRFCSPKGRQGPVMGRTFESPELHAEVERFVTDVARTLNFPPDQITIRPVEDKYEFTLGGEKFLAGGSYNPASGRVDIYKGGIYTLRTPLEPEVPTGYSYRLRQAGGPHEWEVALFKGPTEGGELLPGSGTHTGDYADIVTSAKARLMMHAGLPVAGGQEILNRPVVASILAHEIQHHRWHTVITQYETEAAAIRDYDNRAWVEHKGLPYHELGKKLLTNPAGFLREEHRATYPTVAALEQYLVGGPARSLSGKRARAYPITDDLHDRLRKEDGVSDYSRSWWKAWETGSGVTWKQAFNETQAEVAASLVSKKYGRKIEAPKPAWRKFYHAINREYTRLRRERRTRHAA
ncbi:MAG TPA: hypothetical protein VFP01_11330 [Propionibacteriaceae bacterium]|nr:hypothetical protein [Propionibacteriaceae bacterium]